MEVTGKVCIHCTKPRSPLHQHLSHFCSMKWLVTRIIFVISTNFFFLREITCSYTATPINLRWNIGDVCRYVMYFFSLLNGMPVHHRAVPSIKIAGTCMHTWVERGNGVKEINSVFPKNATQCLWPGLQPESLDQKLSVITTRPPCPGIQGTVVPI